MEWLDLTKESDMKTLLYISLTLVSAVFFAGIVSASEIQTDPTEAAVSVDNQLDVFVMSYCPFAMAAEKGILDFMNTLPAGTAPQIRFHYIFYKTPLNGATTYTCLHGEKEINENLVQIMIRDFTPEYFHAYLLARAAHGGSWTKLAAEVGLTEPDINHIQTSITTVGNELIEREYTVAAKLYKVYDGSPAFVWNGKRVKDLTSIDQFRNIQFDYLGVRCSPNGVYNTEPKTDQERLAKQQRAAQKEALKQPKTLQKNEPYAPVADDLRHTLLSRMGESQPARFHGLEIGDLLVLYQQRYIGDAEVEKDMIIYQFDKTTQGHKNTLKQWRNDLPDTLPPIISMQEALAKVKNPDGARLVYISPESDVFPLDPVPTNPCWIVRNMNEGKLELIVFDAVTGRELGTGITPPYTAYSQTGPTDNNPCSGNWDEWANNARNWYNAMGYSTYRINWPSLATVQSVVQSSSISMFYELDHGGSTYYSTGCQGDGNNYQNLYATDIGTWIATYSKMPFTFVGSCGGLCDTTDNTFAYEFTKGSTADTVAVGYCHMDQTYCDSCWGQSVNWQNKLFERMNAGDTIRQAFNTANATYPVCVGAAAGDCMRFHGDTTLHAVPVVKREPSCGDTVTGDVTLTRDLSCAGTALTIGDNDVTIDCQGHTLDGNLIGYGIVNGGYDNVTIKNCVIREFETGIYLFAAADNNKLEFNTIFSNVAYGVYLNDSWSADLNQNNIYSNSFNGLYLYDSKYTNVTDNNFQSNGWHGVQIKPEVGDPGSGDYNYFTSNTMSSNGWSGVGINTGHNTFTGDSANSNLAYGFHVSNAAYNTFTDVDAMSDVSGFYITGATGTTVTSTVVNNTDVWHSKDYGVQIINSTNTTIEKSDIYDTIEDGDSETDIAVYVSGSTGTILRQDTIRQSERGVLVNNSDGTTIEDNTFSNTQTIFVTLQDSDTCTVSGNTLPSSTGSAIQLFSANNNSISNNTITSPAYYGIYMNASTTNTILGNTATGCGSYAAYAISGSNNNDFTSNTFTGNTRGIFISSSTGNEFTSNNVCTSTYQDFYIAPDSSATTTGDNNKCDAVYNYADIGQASACDFGCSGCRRLEDNLSVTTNTTVCPGTYSITDSGTLGVVQIAASNVTLDGNGATLTGPSVSSGYGIISEGNNNVTIKNFTINDYFVLMDAKNGSNVQFLNNHLNNSAAGGRFSTVSNGLMKNNIFTQANQYAAILTSTCTDCKLIYNTFANNVIAVFCGLGSTGKLSNSILWNSSSYEIMMSSPSDTSSLDVSYCDIAGGKRNTSAGTNCTLNFGYGILNVDPLFAGGNDYHLKSQAGRWNPATSGWVTDAATSRAIDAGNPGIYPSYEFVEATNKRVDLGAYGCTTQASKTPAGWSLLTDINTDGTVNFVDFKGLAAAWLLSGVTEEPCDFTRGSIVNTADLSLMVTDWLSETTWH
jgi:parallel beta-helix repeat protein